MAPPIGLHNRAAIVVVTASALAISALCFLFFNVPEAYNIHKFSNTQSKPYGSLNMAAADLETAEIATTSHKFTPE
jgi:hypothetical protein